MNLVRWSSGPPVPVTDNSSPATNGRVRRVKWDAPQDKIGWEQLPPEVLGLLQHAGLSGSPRLAAWADPPRVRDRGADGYTHDIEGWWIDRMALVTIQARRPVVRERPESRRFRSTGAPWTASAVARSLTVVEERTQRWSRPPTAAQGTDGTPEYLQQPWDVLPAAVAARLRPAPTQYGAWRLHLDAGGHEEHVDAYLRDRTQLVMVSAARRAGTFPDPQQAMDAAPWITTIVVGQLGPAVTHELAGPRC